MDVKSYRDLKVWQKSMDLAGDIFEVTKAFPKDERYGLISQLRRAAVSIPSNLAEGSSRRSRQEFIRFINIASGSLSEVETQLLLAEKFNYIAAEICAGLLEKTTEISKMLFGLQRALGEAQAA